MTSTTVHPSLSLVAEPPRQGLLALGEQPARVQQLIALILRHSAEICAYDTGSVELHFHQDTVKGRLVSMWPTA